MDNIVLPLSIVEELDNDPVAIGYFVKTIANKIKSKPLFVSPYKDSVDFDIPSQKIVDSIKKIKESKSDFKYRIRSKQFCMIVKDESKYNISVDDYEYVKSIHPF